MGFCLLVNAFQTNLPLSECKSQKTLVFALDFDDCCDSDYLDFSFSIGRIFITRKSASILVDVMTRRAEYGN